MEQKYSSIDDYFVKNKKFFGDGDSNAEKAFFLLGRYCKKVMASAETYYTETGEENAFQDKVTRLFTQRMIYSIYTSKDKESYRIIIVSSWAAIFIAFMFRSEELVYSTEICSTLVLFYFFLVLCFASSLSRFLEKTFCSGASSRKCEANNSGTLQIHYPSYTVAY